MNKKEALNILIANAVCSEPKLRCDNDCPYYKEDKDCKYVKKYMDFELKEAVDTLKGEVTNG